MAIHTEIDEQGIAVVTMDNPPVNALNIADTYRLAEIFRGYKHDSDVRVAILTSVGPGIQRGSGHQRDAGHGGLRRGAWHRRRLL